MPLLNFKCCACEETFEKLVPMGATEAVCPKCGGTCLRAYEGECNLHAPGSMTGRVRKGAGAPGAGTGKR